jgi:hypothetical protein
MWDAGLASTRGGLFPVLLRRRNIAYIAAAISKIPTTTRPIPNPSVVLNCCGDEGELFVEVDGEEALAEVVVVDMGYTAY